MTRFALGVRLGAASLLLLVMGIISLQHQKPALAAACTGHTISSYTMDTPQEKIISIAGSATVSAGVRGYIYEKGCYINGDFIGIGQFYGAITGITPYPGDTVDLSDLGKVGIWLYDSSSHASLASLGFTLTNTGVWQSSGDTSTVTPASGAVVVKLGYYPNNADNSGYTYYGQNQFNQGTPVLFGPYSV